MAVEVRWAKKEWGKKKITRLHVIHGNWSCSYLYLESGEIYSSMYYMGKRRFRNDSQVSIGS
jgi:hypothetical protein